MTITFSGSPNRSAGSFQTMPPRGMLPQGRPGSVSMRMTVLTLLNANRDTGRIQRMMDAPVEDVPESAVDPETPEEAPEEAPVVAREATAADPGSD